MKKEVSLNRALDDFQKYLEYLKDDGNTSLEIRKEVLAEWRKQGPSPTRSTSLPSTPATTAPATTERAPDPVRQAILPRRATPSPPAVNPAPATASRLTIPPPAPGEDPGASLRRIAAMIDGCRQCSLNVTRTRTVPGQGNPQPEVLFIGEAPGEDEDLQGLAFVGRAGQLLTRMIQAMGFTREEVFIANILKCRPPNNRPPLPEEMTVCLPFLKAQIAILKPKVIVALGGTAVKGLLQSELTISRLRGQWHTYEGIPLMPTFHPSYLLRNESAKKDTWEDLKQVLQRLGRHPPDRKPSTGKSPPA